MSALFAASHEVGHAFILQYAGVAIHRIEVHLDPGMGSGEWGGEVFPDLDQMASLDRLWAIMSFYAGPLVEAKARASYRCNAEVEFNCDCDEFAFIVPQPTQESDEVIISFRVKGQQETIGEPLRIGTFHADVMGNTNNRGAFRLADEVGRRDVLVPLCRLVRRFLDLPAIWNAVSRYSTLLADSKELTAPMVDDEFHRLLEAETRIAAFELWKDRGAPLWDDHVDWFQANGRSLLDEDIAAIVASGPSVTE